MGFACFLGTEAENYKLYEYEMLTKDNQYKTSLYYKFYHDNVNSPQLAPEILEEKPYDEMADIWAIGMLAYTMLHGPD